MTQVLQAERPTEGSANAAAGDRDAPRPYKESDGAAISLSPAETEAQLATAIANFGQPLRIVQAPGIGRFALSGAPQEKIADQAGGELVGLLPPCRPSSLGARSFLATHGSRFAYVVGEMARGIASAEMVIAAAKAGLFGFFGAAGLRRPVIAEAIGQIQAGLGAGASSWGANLIHNPHHPESERDTVDLYLERGVARVSASAFMQLSLEVVRYAARGLSRDAMGNVSRATHVFAKVSRTEVAEPFMSPPPADLLRELAAAGRLTAEQAELQSRLPVAEDITVESDSGGHTDNRPILVLLPAVAALRERLAAKHGHGREIRLGAAGGLGTPVAVAAAFQAGADYVMTGSVNQSAVESGLSMSGRELLAQCGMADVAMAPAADMFELGVKVQVVKRGTMFAIKAQRLYDLYRRYDNFEDIPQRERSWVETQVLRDSFANAWAATRAHHAKGKPELVATADRDGKQRMGLTFRAFLFMASQWAREGHKDRLVDFQIWCGPAMGAFNDWVKGSFLEPLANRTVAQIAWNLLQGATIVTRAQQLRAAGVSLPASLLNYRPRPLNLV